MVIHFDNLTKKEEKKLTGQLIKDKEKIAPDARGTIVKGQQKQLPSQTPKELKSGED